MNASINLIVGLWRKLCAAFSRPRACTKCGCSDNLSRILYYDTCPTCRQYVDARYQQAKRNYSALALAKQFNTTYEHLAPKYGYKTRTETREFDPTSANGKLMVAVCQSIIQQIQDLPECRDHTPNEREKNHE